MFICYFHESNVIVTAVLGREGVHSTMAGGGGSEGKEIEEKDRVNI